MKPHGYWTEKRCYDEAKKYVILKDFRTKSSSCYLVALRKKWLKNYTWLKRELKRKGYWNYETCKKEALKYSSLQDFRTLSKSAYRVATENKWVNDYTWLLKKHKEANYWTYDRCIEIAKTCKNKLDFQNKSSSAYSAALKHKWLKDWEWLSNEYFEYTDKIDTVYAYIFNQQHSVYIGRTINKEKRDKEHLFDYKDTVYKYAKEQKIQIPKMTILEVKLTIKEGVKQEGYWVDFYKEKGWKVLNKAKTGSIGSFGRHKKWNKNECQKITQTMKNRNEFLHKYPSAYKYSKKNGWLDEWFGKNLTMPPKYWNYNRCKEIAQTCEDAKAFKEKVSNWAYFVADHKGWLDEWFVRNNPYKPRNYWNNKERCQEVALLCKNKSEFQRKYHAAYKNSIKNHWLGEFFPKRNIL